MMAVESASVQSPYVPNLKVLGLMDSADSSEKTSYVVGVETPS